MRLNTSLVEAENKIDSILYISPLEVSKGQLVSFVSPGMPIAAEKDQVSSYWEKVIL